MLCYARAPPPHAPCLCCAPAGGADAPALPARQALELPVLIQLARSDGKEALDEALKEMGVSSIGHRLKIFSALQ